MLREKREKKKQPRKEERWRRKGTYHRGGRHRVTERSSMCMDKKRASRVWEGPNQPLLEKKIEKWARGAEERKRVGKAGRRKTWARYNHGKVRGMQGRTPHFSCF